MNRKEMSRYRAELTHRLTSRPQEPELRSIEWQLRMLDQLEFGPPGHLSNNRTIGNAITREDIDRRLAELSVHMSNLQAERAEILSSREYNQMPSPDRLHSRLREIDAGFRWVVSEQGFLNSSRKSFRGTPGPFATIVSLLVVVGLLALLCK